MSPLTKALVLLVTVLSILLVALVVPFVAKTDQLNTNIADLQVQLQGAKASAQTSEAARRQLEQTLDDGESQLRSTNLGLIEQNNELKNEAAALQAQLKESSVRIDSLGASLNLLTNSQTQLTALLEDRTSALSEAQSSNVNLQKEIAQLVQRNSELDNQVQGLTRTVRTQNEKIVEMQSQLAGGGGGNTGGSGTAPTASGAEIRGAITGVQNVNEVTFVELNVGANDQVSEGTQFTVFRNGNEYVGTATVRSVDETVSIARIDRAQSSVRAGDGVITGIRY